jgi:hypothetical protein
VKQFPRFTARSYSTVNVPSTPDPFSIRVYSPPVRPGITGRGDANSIGERVRMENRLPISASHPEPSGAGRDFQGLEP